MKRQASTDSRPKPAGYEALIARYQLEVIPNWHRSFVTFGVLHRKEAIPGIAEETYPTSYWPGDSVGDHLEFAIKYDGTNLAILARLFQVMPQQEILDYVQSKPTGKYARRLWFLYEFLTDAVLPLDDLKQGNYVDLLDPKKYYTVTPERQIRRQRVNDNLLGDRRFCATVRRTDALRAYEKIDFAKKCEEATSAYPPELLKRALSYLYINETKSSFEIEQITPDASRIERFVALLQLAEKEDFCDKTHFVALQNRIVDPRFHASDFREVQNYVGESAALHWEKVHFACPKPEDLGTLMDGLIAAHGRMEDGGVPAAVHAAVVAYGFVFLHPFEDGNGRIHRFLIHNILARRDFTPNGMMFPVSASMRKHPGDYDKSLEAFSRFLMPLIDYSLDELGRMTVHNDTVPWYAYIDMTSQAEALFRFIELTIDVELTEELAFLANYDETKKAIQQIVDMPDLKIDQFIRFCLQNNGRLSSRKRESHFSMLSPEEIERMEQAIQAAYGRSRS